MTLPEIKSLIWNHRKVHRNPVDLQLAADRAGVRLPITQIHEAEKLLKSLNPRIKRTVRLTKDQYKRYRDAKYNYQLQTSRMWVIDGHFVEPENPVISTSNGLTRFITDYATWMGCHANRINTSGRQVNGKWITGTTKKGTADISMIICGRSIHLEIKAGNDKPSEAQLKQQEQIRRAGGVYEFVHNIEEYFLIFDRYYIKQTTLL